MAKDVPTWWLKEAPNTNPKPTYPRPKAPPSPPSKEVDYGVSRDTRAIVEALGRIERKLDVIIENTRKPEPRVMTLGDFI